MPASTSAHRSPWSLSRAEWVLVAITMFWGGTFITVQHALSVTGPMFFVGLRFATAALVMAVLSARILRGLTWLEIKAGCLIGLGIALGYGLQTVGLQTITSSQSAFITALYVPIVPLLQWLILRRPPRRMTLVGVAMAFVGLVLLAGPEGSQLRLSTGEVLTLLSALAIAAEILLIGTFAGKVDVRRVTVVQLAVASLCGFAAMAPSGESVPPMSILLLASALGLGLASALIQFGMNWAQRSVSPTRATLIYAGEPVWAGLIGRIAGERLPFLGLVGGALIVASIVVSQLGGRDGKPRQSPSDER